VSECPKCGKIIKSGESLCNDCKAVSSPGLSVGVDTEPQEENLPEVDEIEHARLSEDPGKEDMLNSASEISSQEDQDERLALEEDLIKVQEDPFDDFNRPESGNREDDSEPLVQTSISDEIEPRGDIEDETMIDTDMPDNRPGAMRPGHSEEMTTDKLYVIPDKTVSSTERDKLISSLQSKIPNIMQQKQTDMNLDESRTAPLAPEKELWKEERKHIDDDMREEKEPLTEILSAPLSFSRENKENLAVFVRGSKMFFPAGTNLKTGEQVSLGGRSYSIKKRELNKRRIILAGILGVVLIFCIAVILPRIFAPSLPGQVVGLVVNSETNVVIPSAEIILNGLDETLITDANGMFEYEGLKSGDWSVIATKPHYRTASLGFNLSHGKTSVITLYMEPVIPSSAPSEGQDKNKPDDNKVVVKTPLYGHLLVNTNIDQAMVIVDNKVLGPSNKIYSQLSTGEHKLVVMKEGYKEYSGTFQVKDDQTTTLDVDLEEIEIAYNPSEISFDEYLAKADDLAAKGSWQEAAGNYTMALAKQEEAGIYRKRAIAYFKLGQKNQALSDYLKASRQYTRDGHISQSIDCLTELLKIDPGNTTSLRERGFAFLRTGDYQGALADLQNAVELDEESFANQIALGEALYIMGDYKEALKYLKNARKLDQNNARAYALSALASMARGKEKDARRYFREFETRAADIDVREFSGDPDWQRLAHLVAEDE
jgi:Flp pilus assembly protein TadD